MSGPSAHVVVVSPQPLFVVFDQVVEHSDVTLAGIEPADVSVVPQVLIQCGEITGSGQTPEIGVVLSLDEIILPLLFTQIPKQLSINGQLGLSKP